jgi:co-chaperonin GroES (HSP10)
MLTPYPGRAIVEPIPEASETASGLVLAMAKEVPVNQTGKVLLLHPDDHADFGVGDTIAYTLSQATQFRHDGETYMTVPLGAIFAVVEA